MSLPQGGWLVIRGSALQPWALTQPDKQAGMLRATEAAEEQIPWVPFPKEKRWRDFIVCVDLPAYNAVLIFAKRVTVSYSDQQRPYSKRTRYNALADAPNTADVQDREQRLQHVHREQDAKGLNTPTRTHTHTHNHAKSLPSGIKWGNPNEKIEPASFPGGGFDDLHAQADTLVSMCLGCSPANKAPFHSRV